MLQTAMGRTELARITADFESGEIPFEVSVPPSSVHIEFHQIFQDRTFSSRSAVKNEFPDEVLAGSAFTNCCFRWISLSELALNHTRIEQSDMLGTEIRGTKIETSFLIGVDARWSEWQHSSAVESAVTACDLSGSQIRNCDFSGADLTGTRFVGADLHRADFSGANLTRCNFTGCNLTGVKFTGATFKNTLFAFSTIGFDSGDDLPPVQLKQANFYEVRLADGTRPMWPSEPLGQSDRSVLKAVRKIRFLARNRWFLAAAMRLGLV